MLKKTKLLFFFCKAFVEIKWILYFWSPILSKHQHKQWNIKKTREKKTHVQSYFLMLGEINLILNFFFYLKSRSWCDFSFSSCHPLLSPNNSISVATRGHLLTITLFMCVLVLKRGHFVNAAISLWWGLYLRDTSCLNSHSGHITVLLCSTTTSCVYFLKLLAYWHFYVNCFIFPWGKISWVSPKT